MDKIFIEKEYEYISRQKGIDALCKKYPFIKRMFVGKSCLGKEITGLKIGNGAEYNLIAAAFHGSERLTALVCLMFIEQLCFALKENVKFCGVSPQNLLRRRGVIFVPCVNPDGCDISLLGETACGDDCKKLYNLCKGDFSHWNANARGVDINHNFDADWENLHKKEQSAGIFGPAPTRYGGPFPHSEPETAALVELCRKNYIRQATALHSQGEVIYWKFGASTPYKSKPLAEIMATSSGYSLDVPESLATGGGFKDWFIKEFRRPAFTVELGRGKNPLPITDASEILEKVKEMLLLCSVT